MRGQGCPQAPHTTCSPNPPLTPSFSQQWKLVFQLLSVGSSWERQVLTKVFLKGKFTEQLNPHSQSQGETLVGRRHPAHLACHGLQAPPGVDNLCPGAALLADQAQRRSVCWASSELWADPAPPQGAPGARAWGSAGAGLVLFLRGGTKAAQQGCENGGEA